MGRSNIISGESASSTTYIPNFATVPGQQHHNLHFSQTHHSSSGGSHQLPSPSHPDHHPHHHHHSQYLNHLANAAHFYESNNEIGNGGTPPARVYSPLSHGSNSSTGSSALSFVSGSGGSGCINNSNGSLSIVDAVNCVKYEFESLPQEPDGGPVKTTTWKDRVAVFNIDQVGVMCDVLLQEDDMPRLVDLLSTVAKDFLGRSEKILRAQAHVAFHAAMEDARKFPQVYKILESNSFSSQYHSGLQKLWFAAHYKEAEITRGRDLGAVDKYRIRRKFPLPRTIWDGEETVYCFKERSRNALRESFRLEKYPNLEEKKKLSAETGLTMTQVGNWFKNKRQREKEKEQGKAAAKRPKSSYNSPLGLASMTPDLLGMMFNGNGGNVNQAHLPPHHHHHYSHPSAHQQPMPPLSPEDFENAIKKARFADDTHRLKSYIDDGIYSSPVVSSSTLSNLSQYHPNGVSLVNNVSSNGNRPSSPRQTTLSGKSDNNTMESSGIPNSQQHHSPRLNNNGLIVTAVPSPSNGSNCGHMQHPGSPSEGGNSSPGPGGRNEGYGNRPRSTGSMANATIIGRCGTDLSPYVHGSHHHHAAVAYHTHPHLQVHPQSIGSPLPGYQNGIAPLIHASSAQLSHA